VPAGVTTLSAVRTAAAQRADMPAPSTTTFVTTSEWNGLINASYQELYGLLAQKFGDDYFTSISSNITTDGLTDLYDLPSDFFKLLGVDLQVTATPPAYVTVRPFAFAERNSLAQPNLQPTLGVTNLRYRLKGSKLWLAPFPAANQVLRLHYVPRLTLLSADGDTLDGVNGWEEYVVVDAALKAKDKEESDVSVLAAEKAALVGRIEAEAENRDAGAPATVADVRSDLWPGPGWMP
jgi:hypothetical protein